MAAISSPDDNDSTKIVAVAAAVTAVAAVAVGTRLYVRLSMIRSFGWDVSCCSVARQYHRADILIRMQ